MPLERGFSSGEAQSSFRHDQKKSSPAPDCLAEQAKKADGDYKCGTVLDRLKEDFCNKCYICETKAPSTINVTYEEPYDSDLPVVCMDEQPVQLHQETRTPIPATRNHARRVGFSRL